MSELDASFRQRLGSRIERHVLRSAVDMLDERGTELDAVDQDLQRREADLRERTAHAEVQETEVEQRERRLAELGADHISGQPRIDHLIRQLDRAETALAQVRAEARNELAAAQEHSRALHERVKRVEETEHRRLLTQADLTRRESSVSSRERELREHDENLRRRAQELDAKQQGLHAHDRRLAERERRIEASEVDLRKRIGAFARREQELEEREEALRGRDTGWWTVPGPASGR